VLLSQENVRNYCLGRIGRDRVCLLKAEMCDVVKDEIHKLEIEEAMVHIMAPTTKQTKFAAYEALALAVATLTYTQSGELTQEQHPVNDWNRIIWPSRPAYLNMNMNMKRSNNARARNACSDNPSHQGSGLSLGWRLWHQVCRRPS
jgi:hypothetical protein